MSECEWGTKSVQIMRGRRGKRGEFPQTGKQDLYRCKYSQVKGSTLTGGSGLRVVVPNVFYPRSPLIKPPTRSRHLLSSLRLVPHSKLFSFLLWNSWNRVFLVDIVYSTFLMWKDAFQNGLHFPSRSRPRVSLRARSTHPKRRVKRKKKKVNRPRRFDKFVCKQKRELKNEKKKS